MNSAGLRLGHPGFAGGFIVIDPTVVPKSSISNNVKDDEDDHYNNVDDRDSSPALLEATQHTSLARVARIT